MFEDLMNRIGGFWLDMRLTWRLFQDRRVPPTIKLVPLLAAIYVFSPLDFLPDVIPVLGQVDDILIISMSMRLFERLSPPDVVEEHRYNLKMNQDSVQKYN
ncbi:MAG: DUF1232 domain-containing protein [Chloroflexota bacterium]